MALSAKAKPLHRKSARRLIWMHCPNAARWDAKCQWHDGAHAGVDPQGDDASRCQCGRGCRGRLRTRHTARDGSIRCGSARGDDERRHPAGTAGPARTSGTRAHCGADVLSGSFVSAARGGIDTNWAIARPPGQTQPLRPVIALHGKGADAAQVMAGGVEQGLAQAVDAGLPPFAVVAVDGGGGYWHNRA